MLRVSQNPTRESLAKAARKGLQNKQSRKPLRKWTYICTVYMIKMICLEYRCGGESTLGLEHRRNQVFDAAHMSIYLYISYIYYMNQIHLEGWDTNSIVPIYIYIYIHYNLKCCVEHMTPRLPSRMAPPKKDPDASKVALRPWGWCHFFGDIPAEGGIFQRCPVDLHWEIPLTIRSCGSPANSNTPWVQPTRWTCM